MKNIYFTCYLFLIYCLSSLNIKADYLLKPESIIWDDARDRFYISNVNAPTQNDGYISIRTKKGELSNYIVGSMIDPKGMLLLGDTLYVCDVTRLIKVDVEHGYIVATLTAPNSSFLNDICYDGKNYIYMSDTQSEVLFRYDITKSQIVKLATKGNFPTPNGLWYETEKNRILAVSFADENAGIYAINPVDLQVTLVKGSDLKHFDGITRDRLGNWYISSWDVGNPVGGKIYMYPPDFSGLYKLVGTGYNGPADIFFHKVNDSLYIPNMNSNNFEFLYFPAVPDQPVLLYPNNNAVDVSRNLTFQWNKANATDSFRIQVSTVNDFKTLEKNVIVKIPSAQINGLSATTKYYWRVQGINPTGNSKWSDVWSFTTMEASLEAPLTIAPSSNEINVILQPDFNWYKPQAGDSYILQISANKNFSAPLIADVSSIPDTTYKLTFKLKYRTIYFWRVCAVKAGQNGPFSDAVEFLTTDSIPGTPDLNLPLDNATDISILGYFDWRQMPRSLKYEIMLSTASDFSDNSFIRTFLPDVPRPAKLDTLLKMLTKYYWKMRAVNNAGASAWSLPWSFTTNDKSGVGDNSVSVSNISIYPNPSYSGSFFIELNFRTTQPIKMSLYDSKGAFLEKIFDGIINPMTNKIPMNVINLPDGTYYINTITKEKVYLDKFVLIK